MNGGRRNDEKDNKEEGGWASTFFKIAGAAAATAAVVGGLYSVLNQPQAEVVGPYGTPQPDRDVVILKVDGSLRLEKASAGCGGYLSSASQKWLCGFAQKLNPSLKPNETERHAILTGLNWVKKMRKRKVEVESDCKTVVDLVNSRSACTDPVISKIRELLDSPDWEVELSWIHRDEIKVADKLADIALELPSLVLHHYGDPPPDCVLLL